MNITFILAEIHRFFVVSAPDMPPETWWVAALVLLVLGISAAIDAFTATVPDPLIFFGTVGIVGAEGMYVTWPFAAHQLTFGLIAAAIVWGVNEIWYRIFKHDALGLGDAKWSMLAVTCFGWLPVLLAWGAGAIFGAIWFVAVRLIRRAPMTTHVHFAPFLFVGLIAGIWAAKMDGLALLLALNAP
jgi:leader peptidase (prepilin peptidase)/N-methyltransferase